MAENTFKFKVDKAEAVRALKRRETSWVEPVFRAMADGGRRVQRELAEYPPQRNSGYVRTGTLGRRWQLRTSRGIGTLRVNVYNATEYSPFVQGEGSQASFHRGYWNTDQKVLEGQSDSIIEGVQGALIRALR
jgi:hypothetical protein